MDKLKEYVETLVKAAAEASDASDAMKYSQAAVNAANAMCALKHVSEQQ